MYTKPFSPHNLLGIRPFHSQRISMKKIYLSVKYPLIGDRVTPKAYGD